MKIAKIRSNKGISLATVLAIAMISGLLIMAMFESILPSLRGTTEAKRTTAMRCCSESALDYVVNRIAAGDANYIPTTLGSSKNVTIPTNVTGTYGSMPVTASATIVNTPCPATSYLYHDLWDPTAVNSMVGTNGWLVVTANSTVGGESRTLRAVLKPNYSTVTTTTNVTVMTPQTFAFTKGMQTDGPISTNGGIQTNSMNSSNGKSNLHHGDLASNGGVSTAGAAAVIDGTVTVPTSMVGATKSSTSGATITGGIVGGPNLTFPPTPAIPPTAKSLAPITVTGNKSYNLAPGDWFITANNAPAIDLGGQAVINISGKTRIWVTGESPTVSLAGGGVANATQVPSNFQLYYLPTNPSTTTSKTMISFKGSGSFHGVIYAPNAGIQLQGNGSLYGAAVGAFAGMGGGGSKGGFFYDEALSNVPLFSFESPTTTTTTTSSSAYQRAQCVSWEEM